MHILRSSNLSYRFFLIATEHGTSLGSKNILESIFQDANEQKKIFPRSRNLPSSFKPPKIQNIPHEQLFKNLSNLFSVI